METFLSRWWVTRRLYFYINWNGDFFDINQTVTDVFMSTRSQRVTNGVDEHIFIAQYLNDMRSSIWYFWRNISSLDIVKKTIDDCVKINWIERKGTRINITDKGMEVYHLFYPISSFILFCERHKIGWVMLSGLIGYLVFFWSV